MGALYQIYRCATGLVSPLVPTLLRKRLKRGKEDAARLPERLGHAAIPRPAGPLVWLHGASVGETVSILPLVEGLQKLGLQVLLTSGTVTSAEIAAKRLPVGAIHQFVPLDTPAAARRFVAHWHPEITIFAESEIWPNLLYEALATGSKLGIVNGRMSEKSFGTWKKLLGLIRPLLSSLSFCLAQSEPDAARYRALGAANAINAGNLKFDVAALPAEANELARLRSLIGNRKVLVAASTHPGEDESIILAHRVIAEKHPDLLTIIAPRHPERGADIAAKAGMAGCATALRSRGEGPDKTCAIYVADTMGELGLWFSLANLAFLGGSFIPHGGQNPIEPAKFGVPVLHGPHVFNFTDVYAAFDAGGGAEPVADGDALAARVSELLSNPAQRDIMRTHSLATAQSLGGALARTLAVIAGVKMSQSEQKR